MIKNLFTRYFKAFAETQRIPIWFITDAGKVAISKLFDVVLIASPGMANISAAGST